MDFLLSMNFPELKGEVDGDVVLGVQGPQGKPGIQGPQGIPGPQGEPFTYEDFTPEQLESLRGPRGEPFTYEDFTAEQLEALRGEPGVPGKDGVSASHRWDGTVLMVTSASGTSSADLKGEPGYTPQKGIDYYTEADKKEMVNLVIAALPVYNGEVEIG